MKRKKVLWLCSWYPNRIEPFNGDFIQRHAKAASLYADVFVIHVSGVANASVQKTEISTVKAESLTEKIVLFKKGNSFPARIKAHLQWIKHYKVAISEYIAQEGEPDYVHVHVPLKAGIAALWLKRMHNKPYVLTEHWGIYNDAVEDNYAHRSFFFRQQTKKVIKGAAKFISVSQFLAEGVNRLVTQKPYSIIENTVDTSLFYYYEKKYDRPFRFIHVSNMVPLKNATGILHSFHALLKTGTIAELVMVGNTELPIRTLAKQLGLTDKEVQFKGEVPYAQVAAHMQQSDCLVLFSNIENSPCVIGEALCCGLPVIASAVGGVPELVNNENCVLVPAGNEEALTNAMRTVLQFAASCNRKKIAEDAASKFSYPVIGKKIVGLYRDY